MSFRQKRLFFRLLVIAIAVGIFASVSYASISVTIVGPNPIACPTTVGQYRVCATVTSSNTVTKVVFYRNSVPVETDTSSPYRLSQEYLGQDTFTFRARAYDNTGAWADSSEIKFEVRSPLVFKMGDPIPGPSPQVQTKGPTRFQDHTADIQAAIDYLEGEGGGTLVFPCKVPYLPSPPWPSSTIDPTGLAVYNIGDTINVPENVTLQGEGAEELGRCRLYWTDLTWDPDNDPKVEPDPNSCYDNPDGPTTLLNKPMFKIAGGVTRVRFKDLWLYSRSSGQNCYPRYDRERIAGEGTVGIEMNTGTDGDIRDVILENVAISNFTYGIKAFTEREKEYEISGIRMRGYRAVGNHRQLYIDAPYLYDWDMQNININHMMEDQGGVEIEYAGKPASYVGDQTTLKFLQLNCNGMRNAPPAFCVSAKKHSGLYFRQLHHEGVNRAIVVEDISPSTNPDPIVFESSIASGLFKDESMKLYLISNALGAAPEPVSAEWDDIRLRFMGDGLNSTVVDCGDVHWDYTDSDGTAGEEPWISWRMLFTHSERNRPSYFLGGGTGTIPKVHTPCPAGDPVNISEVGGEFFDNGIMPTEAENYSDTLKMYSNVLSAATCPATPPAAPPYADCLEDMLDYTGSWDTGGAVYIVGDLTFDRTVNIPRGSLIVGAFDEELIDAELELVEPDIPLLRITLPVDPTIRTSSVVLRNLKLITSESGTTGIQFIGGTPPSAPAQTHVPPSSDVHFSGLTIEGFGTGLQGTPLVISPPEDATGQPMLDGYSMKSLTFKDNITAVDLFSANTSNWNVMDLRMESDRNHNVGWHQKTGGHVGLQSVFCEGDSEQYMKHCLDLQMVSGFFLNDLKQTQFTTNAVTIAEGFSPFNVQPYIARQYAVMNFRNSDFTSAVANKGRINIVGKSFITSMNNKYGYFNVDNTTEGDKSRLTYCDDTYAGTPYDGLASHHINNWVGVTPTRVQCGIRPYPWDEVVYWGGDAGDQPLVGNFHDNVEEDLVIYRPGTPSEFHVKEPDGSGSFTFDWGSSATNDIPLIGRFYPGKKSQVIVYRSTPVTPPAPPPTSQWYWIDPTSPAGCLNNVPINCDGNTWAWGIDGDIPFVGNFFDESSTGDEDEIAIYRPSISMFCIYNPRSGEMIFRTTTADPSSKIQIGDFLGLGHDQIAQIDFTDDGKWKIVEPQAGGTHTLDAESILDNYTANGGEDIPVAGKYLTGGCTQIGIWKPSENRLFIADDTTSSCGTRNPTMLWGANDAVAALVDIDPGTPGHQPGTPVPDIPLTISNSAGTLRRPTMYRPTNGAFTYSLAKGQWWIHDVF